MEENRIIVEFETAESPAEAAAARQQWEQFDRNSAWLQAHIPEVYGKFRGKCICVAGQELFVADTTRDAVAMATAAHPEDKGFLTRYIYKEKAARIYARVIAPSRLTGAAHQGRDGATRPLH